jgi:2-iminobutanoate/2-iminopropanoate deaminase
VMMNDLIFTAGIGPLDPVTGDVVGESIAEQTHQVINHLEIVLEACGVTLEDVVKATVHLADVQRDFAGFDAAFRERFAPHFPARTTVGSTLLGILVEIDVVAAKPSTGR